MAPNKPGHIFRDPGAAIVEADYWPATVRKVDPKQNLALIFARLGRDYGGPLPADFVLHAMLTPEA
jgi:hypothetical protein